MSNPSLLCVPYRFKTSKLYSQIPDSGLGDFTVTRATTPTAGQATRVNAAGFIETVADNVPRLDYPLRGITAGCPALLVEPSAQNVCPRSQEIDLWTPNAAIVTPNVAISPNGTQNAELFVPNSGSNGRTEINVGTLTNATTYTMTCFMRQHTASLDQVTLYVSDGGGATGSNRWGVTVSLSTFTLSNYTQTNGSVTSTSIENYGNGWYRIRVTGQVTSGMTSTSAVAIRYFGSTANGTNGVLVFGAQFETGSIPTSYIPTTTGPVTRGAETISKTGVSSLIGQTEGTIYAEINYNRTAISKSAITLINTDGSFQNRIQLFIDSSHQLNGVFSNASTAQTITASGTNLQNGINKIALTYTSVSAKLFLNGALQQSFVLTVFPVASLQVVKLGNIFNNALPIYNGLGAVALYTTSLSDAQLQSLTQ